jgi:hypothetical protein
MAEVISFSSLRRGTQVGHLSGPDAPGPDYLAETIRMLFLVLIISLIAGIFFFTSAAQKHEKQRQAIEFNEKCLAQGYSGTVCDQLYRAEHPIGRGY